MEENYGFKPGFSTPNAALSYPPQPPIYPPPNDTSSSSSEQSIPPNPNDMAAYRWINASHGSVPPTAIQGGVDSDGHKIYVGKAYHEGDLIPAKIIPGKQAAYVGYGGQEHTVENYQVLCQQYFAWIPSHLGQIPPGAVAGGVTSDGETLFIGRVFYEGSETIGKVHPSHGVCYIPYDGQEIPCSEYEILISRT